jgi:hypothetical protein
MKTKFYRPIYAMVLLAGVMLFSLTQCKKVGSSDWPEPNPETLNELKFAVYDGEHGDLLSDLNFSVIYPDGIMEEFTAESGKLTLEGNQVGSYIVTASKSGYLSQSTVIEVEETPDEIIAVTKQNFYLNQIGETRTVSASGVTLSIESDFEVSPKITFPEGAVASNTDITVTYVPSPSKFGEFTVLGERVIQSGFNFSPDMEFPADSKPVLEVPVTIPSVINGDAPFLLGSFNENTQEWEIIEGQLNDDRTMATFEMPHFSIWYTFTGYRLVGEVGWSPYVLSGQSETCSEGACGTFVYVTDVQNTLISNLFEPFTFDVSAIDTRCIGPRYLYAQQLFTRCKLTNYKVYNYTGEFIENVSQIPMEIFQWKVEETYCHHQGWGG